MDNSFRLSTQLVNNNFSINRIKKVKLSIQLKLIIKAANDHVFHSYATYTYLVFVILT
jgi:hypothetical protein